MLPIPDSFYARWRVQCGLVMALREDAESPPERLLQAIWQHQRLLRDQLKTLDGRPVRVLHPGFHNLEGGPDFRQAMVQFQDNPPQTGDIEVDLRANGWRAHGHDRNPAFGDVILHVIWEEEKSASNTPPLLCMRGCLDSPLAELSLWLGGDPGPGFAELARGRCCSPLRDLSSNNLSELLRQAAQVRLRSKAARFEARARQAGWEQALWEGLFRALGYKHNVWPMQRLGELRSKWLASDAQPCPTQARLLGISGLLPAELTGGRSGNERYLRELWDLWWRDRDAFSDLVLPIKAWRLHGLRPANHPHRRLALAASWSAEASLVARLEKWCGAALGVRTMGPALLRALQVEGDEFWSWHWTLRSRRFRNPKPLLGAARVADLAVNVVIPWLWTRAQEGKNADVRQTLEDRYFNWPAAADNSVLRLARERLLGGNGAFRFTRAAEQQGLLQLVRDFCDHSDSICQNCKLPELARDLCAANSLGETSASKKL